jgi:uncharacterized protein YqfA (UPF0365 family)
MNVTRLIYNDDVVIVAALLCVVLLSIAFFILFAIPWLRAFLHGKPVSLIQVVGMRLRGTPPSIVIDAYIQPDLKRPSRNWKIATSTAASGSPPVGIW